jgi:hypothetical protein
LWSIVIVGPLLRLFSRTQLTNKVSKFLGQGLIEHRIEMLPYRQHYE